MNTKLLLVSLLMALSAISMPVMGHGNAYGGQYFGHPNKRLLLATNGINFYDEGGPTGGNNTSSWRRKTS